MRIQISEGPYNVLFEDRVNYIIQIVDTILPSGLSLSIIEAAGDLIVGTASEAVTRLPIGSTGQILTVDAGLPKWQTRKFSGAKLGRGTLQTIPNGVYTAVSFDGAEINIGGYWVVGAPTRLTIPVTGYYLTGFNYHWDINATGSRIGDIRRDGAAMVSASKVASSGLGTSEVLSVIRRCVAGSYLEAFVWQNSGGDLNLSAAYNHFWVTFLGE